ncbi:iron chaperone [Microbacterium telephonicum]|uniref:Uncharacterized protein YdhG (YjbR/CyaY superfamily) n=1 Tax=Microbacterium telephonicum TaxID=1714841 RepID=A0A498CIX7_9MICO|nr:DUF1801 domain-containing protein [Microbacterium telephonicum]RLK52890.1 uncharacterized protein YdhG (YjbR/CyaY superfamily) [Microbacterium telephonicum]
MGTIDDYLEGLDPVDAAAIARVYDLARDVVPDATQGLGYGMPALVHRGKSLLSVMRAKKHFGVYPFSPRAIVEVAPLLEGVDHAKGTIRFTADAPLGDELVRSLVAARKAQIEG